jgi:hypothetical protein
MERHAADVVPIQAPAVSSPPAIHAVAAGPAHSMNHQAAALAPMTQPAVLAA